MFPFNNDTTEFPPSLTEISSARSPGVSNFADNLFSNTHFSPPANNHYLSSSNNSRRYFTTDSNITTAPEPEVPADVVSKYFPNKTKAKKTYPCSRCPKFFSRPSALETHSYTHTAEKPFQCQSPGCGRRFSVVSNLRRHFKIHQKASLGNKILSQDRIRCIRYLSDKNSNNTHHSLSRGTNQETLTTFSHSNKSIVEHNATSLIVIREDSGLLLQQRNQKESGSPSLLPLSPSHQYQHYLFLPKIATTVYTSASLINNAAENITTAYSISNSNILANGIGSSTKTSNFS